MENENFEDILEQYTSVQQINAAKKDKADFLPNPKETENPLKHYPKVQRTLDLHGYNANEAKKEIRQFLINAQGAKLKTAEIITGRGWHSPEFKAVLPKMTEELLAELKQERVVYRFKKEKSGGSFIVYLA